MRGTGKNIHEDAHCMSVLLPILPLRIVFFVIHDRPLCSKFLESEHGGRNHMTQCIQEQIRVLPAIEAERHLVQVGREMLGANRVPCSHNAALQETEGILHSVGVDVGSEADILFLRMINCLVPIAEFSECLWVGWQFVCHNYFHILRYVLLDVLSQSPALCIFCMKESQIT